jgi:glycosyltransferase involved in cell wall biosynthesis
VHILIVPSEYPTNDHKLGGIFVKEQKDYLAKHHKIGVIYIYLYSVRKLFSKLIFQTGQIKKNKDKIIIFFPRIPYFKYINYLIHRFLFIKIFKIYVKKNGRPDLLHVHFSEFSIWSAYIIKKNYNIPYVLTEHSTDFLDGKYNKKYKEKSWVYNKIKKALVNAKKIIAVSSSLKRSILKHYNLPKKKLTIISNLSLVLKKRKNYKKEIDIIFVGSFDQRKNPFLLLNAFMRINDNKLNLALVGDGPLKKNIEKFIKEKKLNKLVKIYSGLKRKSVLELIDKSKILVLPSFYETFGVVVIEAYSAGVPVIMTDSLGVRDLYNKNCSILLRKPNLGSLVFAIKYMIKNYKMYKSKYIINFYKKNFSPTVVIEKINKTYNLID